MHLPGNISAEDITMAYQEIDYDVISIKQMTAKRPTTEGGVSNSPLPPLPRNASKETKSSRNLQIDNTPAT
jgi:hypothetical protein